MNAVTKVVACLLLVCVASIALLSWKLTTAQRALTTAQLAPQKASTVAAAAKVETVTVKLRATTDTVTRAIVRYREAPPLDIHDTVEVVRFVERADSVVRACSAFVVSCGEYREAAERRFAADSVYRVGLERALRGAQPSRLGAIWNRVKLPLAFAGGLYVGQRLR